MSSATINTYRTAAAAERLAAARSSLPRVAERHLRAAEAWDVLADQAEFIDNLTKANAKGDAKYAYQRQRVS
jgi:hypothetical protein